MNAYKLKTIQLMITVFIMIIVIVLLISGLSTYGEKYTTVETDRIQSVVEQYAVQCYATEGAYPPSLEYLETHYGLILNLEKYIYEYEAVAENIKPSIRVFSIIED